MRSRATTSSWARSCASAATDQLVGDVRILALTLDLDDTFWPVLPALERADHAVDAWLRQYHPDVARAWPIAAMRALRAQVAAERLQPAHDLTTPRHPPPR